ncbi:MAG TPA: metal ABC transporter permease, partial [Aggregatilineales bacterium]|nr:metal ABC transporter permease [Aggregatilineales bacterium]
ADDVLLITGVGLISILLLLAFWKEFKLITFDPEFAGANGFPLRALDILLSTLIVVAIVLGLQLAGVILMVGLLIAPAVAARQWTHNMGQMVTLAAVFGGFSGAGGSILSGFDTNLPTGPLIIVVAFILVFLSICFAPNRGLLWSTWQQRQDRGRFAAQNVLRDIYRHARQHENLAHPTPEGMLIALRGQVARTGLRELQKDGLARREDKNAWVLTVEGIHEAQEDAHNQELWKLYRLYRDDLRLPLVKEDRLSDIRSVLSGDAIHRLETIAQGK